MGEATRNANVTPSGTPASRKPMNSGTAEHEQNGVTIPKPAAATVPTTAFRPASALAHPLGRHEGAQERDAGDDAGEQQQDLGHVVEEERDGLARAGSRARGPGRRRRARSRAAGQRTTRPARGPPRPRPTSQNGDVDAARGERGHASTSSRARSAAVHAVGVPLVVEEPAVGRVADAVDQARLAQLRQVVGDVVLTLARARRPSRTRSADRRRASRGSTRARGRQEGGDRLGVARRRARPGPSAAGR